jgi:ribonuclease P protein component
MDQRLRQSERLRRREEFTRCYRQGERLRTRYFVMHAYQRGVGRPRLGLAVAKTVGNAVTRNSIKRRLRELFRRHKAAVPEGYDVFVRALPGSAEATFAELTAAWGEALASLAARRGRLAGVRLKQQAGATS